MADGYQPSIPIKRNPPKGHTRLSDYKKYGERFDIAPTFRVEVEEQPDEMPIRRFTAFVYDMYKIDNNLLGTFYGPSRIDVEDRAKAFVSRIRAGETHYSFEL